MEDLARLTTNAIVVTDADRRVQWVNEGFTRLSGYTLDEIFGQNPDDVLIDEQIDAQASAEICERLSAGESFQGELRLRSKDGSSYWVLVDVQPCRDERGHLTGFMSVQTDITERKQEQIEHERALVEQAARTEMALSVGKLGTWHWDVQSGSLTLDDQWTRSTIDVPPADAPNARPWSSRIHREDVGPTLRALSAHLRNGAPFEDVRFRARQRGGGWRWISASGRVVSADAQGRPTRMIGTHSDVTEQAEAQLRLREAMETTELALEAGRMGLWMWDLDTGGFTFDQRWAAMLGERAVDLLDDATTLLTRVHPADIVELEGEIERHAQDATTFVDVQYRVRHRNGSWRWMRLFATSIKAMGRQRVDRIVGIQMDVHEQVEAQVRAARREALLANTIRITAIGGWELEVETEELYWSDEVRLIHEVPPDYTPSVERAIEFYEGVSRREITECVEQGIREGRPWDVECRIVTAKGNRRWVRAVGEPVYENGKIVRLVGAFQDVTDQRAQREALAASNQALEVAQSIARMGSWDHDLRSDEVTWSRQLFELFDCDPTQTTPSSELAIGCYLPADAERLHAAIELAKTKGTPYALTLERREERNGVRYVAVEGRARTDDQDQVIGLYGTARDVTAEVQREAELQEARLRAEDASRSKTEFLANMSHEIRTPMTAILGYAELLDDPTLPAGERSSHLHTIRRNGEYLLTIINDILDVSKIESGRMGVESIETNPADVLRGVGQLMRVNADAKSLAFSMQCSTGVPEVVRTDPTRLRQILVNLIGNAIKFTREGGVTVSMAYEAELDGGTIRIEVQDTGIGMTPEQMDRVFNAFTQADASTTRRFGGTGLGLLISKRIAQMLQGDIAVQSRPGKGSTFTLSIGVGTVEGASMLPPGPLELQESSLMQTSREGGQDGPLAGMSVLVIEDGVDNLRLIEMHLERAGAHVMTARDGVNGIEALTTNGHVDGPLISPLPVQVILTDMQMPRMDGYTTTRKLREKGCDVPIIALTAHTMDGDRAHCIEAGCDAYMEKPTNRDVLVSAIRDALKARSAA
ncbi:MAG: PAS domain-containing protein [Phycisphaerales bacterium]